MTVAVVVFPGSNCEHDVVHALGIAGADAELVWHRETELIVGNLARYATDVPVEEWENVVDKRAGY